MPKVKANDIQVYYEVKGEGFPLMMIAGMGVNIDSWDPRLVEQLARKFKVVVFDNRGAGRTDASDRKYTIKLFADDTVGLMDALGISKAHILGHSMGGRIAQELVLGYPKRVEKLVLCSSSCGGPKSVPMSKDVMGRFMADRSTLSQEEAVRMVTPLFLTEDFIKKSPEVVELIIQQGRKAPFSNEVFKRQVLASMECDTHDRLPQIKAPTLILQGKQDILIAPRNASILAEAIPNAKLVYFEKSAHRLAEEMNEVINSIIDFLV